MQRHDRDAHLGHGGLKFFHTAERAAETVSRVHAGSVGMPKQIAMPFEVVFPKVNFNDAISLRAKPLCVERHFVLARFVDHAAGNHELSVSVFLADENLICSEDHVLKIFDGCDSFNFASTLLQNTTKLFPLSARFRSIYC